MTGPENKIVTSNHLCPEFCTSDVPPNQTSKMIISKHKLKMSVHVAMVESAQ